MAQKMGSASRSTWAAMSIFFAARSLATFRPEALPPVLTDTTLVVVEVGKAVDVAPVSPVLAMPKKAPMISSSMARPRA